MRLLLGSKATGEVGSGLPQPSELVGNGETKERSKKEIKQSNIMKEDGEANWLTVIVGTQLEC